MPPPLVKTVRSCATKSLMWVIQPGGAITLSKTGSEPRPSAPLAVAEPCSATAARSCSSNESGSAISRRASSTVRPSLSVALAAA